MTLSIRESELREQLLKDNAEFRKLAAEHQQYSDLLDNFSNKHFLSDQEQVEEKKLKKKKLMLKDQMYLIVQKARKQLESESK